MVGITDGEVQGNKRRMASEYRKNVAIFVLNDEGLILACERSDVRGAWQLPQGGVEPGESPLEAMYRELLEEIGCCEVEILHQLEEAIRYDWPPQHQEKGYIGQEQVYFLVRLKPGAAIDLERAESPEFQSIEWINAAEFSLRAGGFKREAYLLALERLLQALPGTIREE